MASVDLEWALHEQRSKARLGAYRKARNYYDGNHPLAFATERFTAAFWKRFERFADNLCPAVVDSVADRLKLTGFSSSTARQRKVRGADGKERDVVVDRLATHAWQIWRRNRMAQRANEVHRDALTTGDSYAIVWPDPTGRAAIWPQLTEEIVVEYSGIVPGAIERAARVWRERDGERRHRVTLYYASSGTRRRGGAPHRTASSS
jgi:hypothetical protein